MREHGIGLSQAFRILSIIPMGGKDAKKASTQLFFYPLVGLLISLPGAAAIWALLPFFKDDILLCSVVGVIWSCYMAFMTRGFHLDGLGDMADGFGGGWTKERRLEIMKDSRMGSFGVIAICLCLLLKSTGAAVVASRSNVLLLVWTCTVARTAVAIACSVSSYAKPQGLSHDLVNGSGAPHAIVATASLLAFGVAMYFGAGFVGCSLSIMQLAFPLCVGIASACVLCLVSYRRLGGVTGDILGACCEISECLSMLCCAFVA